MELQVNCGFARAAIRQYSEVGRGKNFTQSHSDERAQKFKELFSPLTQYRVEGSMFESKNGRESPFDRKCKSINSLFRKWKNRDKRQAYFQTFSPENWKKLPNTDKKRHTMGSCRECALAYREQQDSFPGSTYSPGESLVRPVTAIMERNTTMNASETTTTRQILAELQPLYKEAYGHTFTESLSQCRGTGVQIKPTDVEKKRLKRKIQRECREQICQQFAQTDAITVLSEGQSLASYKRMRLSQSFETPEQTRQRAQTRLRKQRKHSPEFDNVTWDREGLLSRLQNWPSEQKINWSQIGREFNIPGKNMGQVVKEFATENGINVLELDHRPPNTRLRARKLRMPGGSVSVPTHRTAEEVKKDWSKMIQSGELTLGEPCYPHTLEKYKVKDGELHQSEMVVYGRKIPLVEVRKKLLKQHEAMMRLHSDEEIASLQRSELLEIFEQRNITLPSDLSEVSLQTKLQECERTRTIGIWHDHSKILGMGYILLTAKIFYDRAIFKTNQEMSQHACTKDVQAYVEEPEISIIAISSSSIQDQAALVGDRVQCIRELNTELRSQAGIPITDRLMFFYGDKPAAQFERGTQIGGHYPCGSCGAHVARFDDFAFCVNCKWRSLQELQKVVVKGPSGRKVGCAKPFERLNNQQLQQELHTREVFDHGTKVPELNQSLKATLCGAQRVPSLMLLDPTQPVDETELKAYTVLDCEPLHDLKGHLQNLFDELPAMAILDKELAKEVNQLMETDLGKDMKTGGDYRLTAIHLLALLRKRQTPPKILQLLESIVAISELLYSDDSKRSPRTILRLYNLTWVHFELCTELLQTTNKISHQKMFGVYLHALTLHAPPQYEILCLKSANTEHEERLFGQAKNMVQTATNRQPTTVIPNILLRLQARQRRGDMYKAYNETSSRVSKAARQIESHSKNTNIPSSFLSGRMSSWQAHLYRISPFLVRGKGVWWYNTDDGYEFVDGGHELDVRPEGPALQHFRSTTLDEVYKQKESLWQQIITDETELPTPFIKLYNSDGNYIGRRTFTEFTAMETEGDSDADDNVLPTALVSDLQVQGPSPRVEEEQEQEVGEEEEELIVQIVNNDVLTETETNSTLNDNSDVQNLQMKLSKAISRALGDQLPSPNLLEFDVLRYQIKTKSPLMPAQAPLQHKKLLYYFKQQLKKRNIQLRQAILDYEHAFYALSRHLPDPSTDPQYEELLKSKRFVAKLLDSREFAL